MRAGSGSIGERVLPPAHSALPVEVGNIETGHSAQAVAGVFSISCWRARSGPGPALTVTVPGMIRRMTIKGMLAAVANRISNLYQTHAFGRKIERALALHRRGEVRSDGLQLIFAETTLRLEWLARSVHPWDSDLPADRAERAFTQQCLADTGAALTRLFAEIPVLDAIEVRVRRSPSQPPLLAGTVQRKCFESGDYSSVGMRLRAIGVTFRMNNLCLEELENHSSQ